MDLERLYRDNRRLLYALARRWRDACARDRAVDLDDLAQAGFFGLVAAAQTFDASAGKSWAAWAAWYIQREFSTALGLRDGLATRAHTGALALDAPPPGDDGDGATLGDLLPDVAAAEADAALLADEVRDTVRAAVAAIPDDTQRQAVQLHDLDGATMADTADALGLTLSQTYGARRRGLSALQADGRLRALAAVTLDDLTPFYARKGLAAFERDLTSTTEAAALWRIDHTRRPRD